VILNLHLTIALLRYLNDDNVDSFLLATAKDHIDAAVVDLGQIRSMAMS
jgi:hypothetical protein